MLACTSVLYLSPLPFSHLIATARLYSSGKGSSVTADLKLTHPPLLTLYNPTSWNISCVLNRKLPLSRCLPFATCIICTRTLNLRLSQPTQMIWLRSMTKFMKRIILHEKEKQDTCWISDWSLQWRSLGLVGQQTVQRWKCNRIKSDWAFHLNLGLDERLAQDKVLDVDMSQLTTDLRSAQVLTIIS